MNLFVNSYGKSKNVIRYWYSGKTGRLFTKRYFDNDGAIEMRQTPFPGDHS